MTLVWHVLKAVIAAVVVTQLACFVLALYEMLNLPETRRARLTPWALAGALRALAVESTGAIVAVLAIPLGALPWRRIPDDVRADRPPVVLVPGYLMTRSCLWILRLRLARAGWPHAIGYNYRTLGGDLHAAARALGAVIDDAAARGAPYVVVIAHGMGGLVARLCLRAGAHPCVRTLVTLGTPHQGSKLHALALDPMAQEMRAGSALLEELADDELPRRADVTAIYAGFDVTVLPSAAAQYPGATNIEVEGVGHVGLLWSSRVFELVRENLEYAHEMLMAELRGGGGVDAPHRPAASGPGSDRHGAPSASTQRATSSASE